MPSLTGRYACYQATLTGDGTVSPVLTGVFLDYGGTDTSQVLRYRYDGAANMVSREVVNSTGTTLEVRNDTSWSSSDQINNLNQILRNDVLTGARYDNAYQGTDSFCTGTTYRYAYDASGNMTSKTPSFPITGTIMSGSDSITGVSSSDTAQLYLGAPVANSALPSGTTVSTIGSTSFTVNHNATANASAATITVTGEVTSFTWDEDNRLTQVTLPGGATIAYTYDVTGRMLTRTDTSGTTVFEWDGFNCIREAAPESGSAVYNTAHYSGSDDWERSQKDAAL